MERIHHQQRKGLMNVMLQVVTIKQRKQNIELLI